MGSSIFAPVIGDSGTGQNVTSLEIAGLGPPSVAIWTLTGANTYTGGTTAYEGTLNTAGAGRLGPGPLSIAPAGVDEIVQFPAVVNLGTNQTLSSLACTGQGTLTVAQGTTLTVAGAGPSYCGGDFVVSGTVAMQGDGPFGIFDPNLTMNNNTP